MAARVHIPTGGSKERVSVRRKNETSRRLAAMHHAQGAEIHQPFQGTHGRIPDEQPAFLGRRPPFAVRSPMEPAIRSRH